MDVKQTVYRNMQTIQQELAETIELINSVAHNDPKRILVRDMLPGQQNVIVDTYWIGNENLDIPAVLVGYRVQYGEQYVHVNVPDWADNPDITSVD